MYGNNEIVYIKGHWTAKMRKWDPFKFEYGPWLTLGDKIPNLLTNAGRDYFHQGDYTNTASSGRGCNFVAVSENTAAPAAGDTTLAGEITTGGLARKVADTITHTLGTNTSQLITTWTATIAFSAVSKGGTFNALAGGTLGHEFQFAPAALNINDQLQLTNTFTLG